MTARTGTLECDCGDCRSCRRALGFTPTHTQSVELSESTRRVLAQLDEPTPTPRPTRPRKSATTSAAATHRSGYCRSGRHALVPGNLRQAGGHRECLACHRERYGYTPRADTPPDPVPCGDCGGLIGARLDGYRGWVRAGTNGLCEVCADRPRHEKYLADYATWDPATRARKNMAALRARRHLQRVLRDGRAYYPDVTHGTSYSYTKCGCRCSDCCAWKTSDNLERRNRLGRNH